MDANFINALDITAKNLTVLDESNKPLLKTEAKEGIGKVKIAGFDVSGDALQSGVNGTNNFVHLGTDGIQLGNNFKVDPTGKVVASDISLTGYITNTDFNNGMTSLDESLNKAIGDVRDIAQSKNATVYSESEPNNPQEGDC